MDCLHYYLKQQTPHQCTSIVKLIHIWILTNTFLHEQQTAYNLQDALDATSYMKQLLIYYYVKLNRHTIATKRPSACIYMA